MEVIMEESKQRGIFFSKGAKAVVIVLYLVAIGFFSAAAFVLLGILQNGFQWEEIEKSGEMPYYETNECGEQSAQLIRYVSNVSQGGSVFLTDGKIDMKKTVDITDPNATGKQKNKNTTYTLENLREMYQQDEIGNIDQALYDVKNGYGYYDEEELPEMADGENAYQYSEQFIYLYDTGKKTETILPESGVALADYAKANPEDVSLMDLYQSLVDVSDQLDNCLICQEYLDQSTNMKFAVEDMDSGVVYTNVPAWADGYQKETTANGEDKMIFQAVRENGALTDIIEGQDTEAGRYIKNFFTNSYLCNENEKITIVLDTTFPVEDEFYYANQYYAKYAEWGNVLLACLLISFLVGLLAFSLACLQTGRSRKNLELQLNGIDKVPTEVMVSGGIIALGIMISMAALFVDNTGLDLFVIVICILGELFLGALFLGFTMSIVRRMKGHLFWKSSLCYTIVQSCKSVYMARKTSSRMIIFFIGFVLGNMFMISAFDGFGFLLSLIADSLVLLYLIRENAGRQVIKDGLGRIASGELDFKIDAKELIGDNQEMAEAVNHVGEGLQKAVQETLKSERLKADLITNVSHDIKTPLTSIINYVDLLKREDIQDPRVKGYIDILESKSQRLKQLTEDLVEASKVSSGNVVLDMRPIQFGELIRQTNGEFEEKFSARNLQIVCSITDEPLIIMADGRRMWRVVENLYNNVAKYAMENSRVYVEAKKIGCRVIFEIKNISANPLNIKAEELTERFIRGDVSRNTEGSGLGLSIAQNLVKLQHGTFDIYLDGDLFKVTITFDAVEPEKK
ncbi:MAG: HAMP domain-containing histidine kinase [Clostridia bacterium]|nr:HAMP domain-containing histidine kinase [Clostridia bacterium]